MLKLSKDQQLSPELIKKIVNKHQTTVVDRMELLNKYYNTKNVILNRIQQDDSKPNNKVAHPYASYITDTLTGYFMGEGITYLGDDDKALEELTMILEYNDAQDEDMELAKDMSIFGMAIELQYIDEDGFTRIKRLDPRETVLVYDDTLDEDLLYCIRYYLCEDILTDKRFYRIEVYTKDNICTYTSDELINTLTPVDVKQHFFGLVPVSVYYNNEETIGDFEPVISLIDAYDKMESDSLNDFEYFVDAYLCLTGLMAESEDIKDMKQNRILLLDQDSDAKWLIKDTNDTNIENVKSRIDSDIHKFSKVPDMSDEAFSGNASGVAIKYKTLPMENIVAIKERKFKKGLQRRIELIFNILGLKGSAYDWRGIEINFTRNLPTNDLEIAQMVSTLKGMVSNETLLAQIPFVNDVQNEIDRVQEQEAKIVDDFYKQDFQQAKEDKPEENLNAD